MKSTLSENKENFRNETVAGFETIKYPNWKEYRGWGKS